MVKRKLNPFTADDAGDSFTPSVKTIKGGDIKDETKETEKSQSVKSKSTTKSSKKTEKKSVEKKSPESSTANKKPQTDKKSEGSTSSDASVDNNQVKPAKPSSQKVAAQETTPDKTVAKKQEGLVQSFEKTVENAQKDKPVRKKKLKSKKEPNEVKEVIYELVGFMLGDEEFGIDIGNVSEINRMVDITPVPRAPFFVVGVMNLRGNVVPVVNLRRRLNVEDKKADNKTRIIVVEVLNTVVGFVVDSVSEVLRISASIVEPASDLVAGIQAEYIKGVAKLETRLMVLLDLEKILAKENIDQLKETTL